MVPQFYRFVMVNNTAVLMTVADGASVNLKITAVYIDPSTGKYAYNQLADDDLGIGATLADGAEILGGVEYDNTSNKYTSLQVQLEVALDLGGSIAAGATCDLYIAGGDVSGELPTDASGYGSAELNRLRPVGVLVFDPAMSDDELARSQVWRV